ncbi:MAG: hypothetical protein ACYCTZ_09870 [Candidatus Dormibacteria bacterium]
MGSGPAQRSPFAMFYSPARRSAPIARLHRLAIACGDFAVRTWDRTLPRVASQWTRFPL